MRFDKKGKLSTRYVGPYEISIHVGKVAYELSLPSEYDLAHPVFNVSILKRLIGDQKSILPFDVLKVDASEETLVEILDRQVKRLRSNEVAFTKVLWRNHLVEGATWEAEADMKSHYPHLFTFTSINT